MIDSFVLVAPIYLLGVMALLGFVGCFTKPPRPEDPSRPFVTRQKVITLTTGDAWVGMTFEVGADALTVFALGRFFIPGNNATHRIRLVDAADPAGQLVLVTVDMAGGPDDPDDPYIYTTLPSPFVTLQPGALYHLVSEEKMAGDEYGDQNTEIEYITTAATVKSPVYSSAPGLYVPIAGLDHSFGPVNFKYVADFQ